VNKLYIGNLPYSVNDSQLEEMFSEFGKITSAVVITDRQSGRSKGFGFVEFETDAEAAAALAGMDGKEIDGRALKVSEARPQVER
jgi:cold-inducible RNA-binding protein